MLEDAPVQQKLSGGPLLNGEPLNHIACNRDAARIWAWKNAEHLLSNTYHLTARCFNILAPSHYSTLRAQYLSVYVLSVCGERNNAHTESNAFTGSIIPWNETFHPLQIVVASHDNSTSTLHEGMRISLICFHTYP